MKTIKEIADEIGVSKQAIRDKIAKLELGDQLQRNGKYFVISEVQEILIKSEFLKNKPQSETAKLLGDQSQTLQSLCDALESQLLVLQEQLKIKDDQIKELNLRLSEAHEMIDHAQKLHGADKAKELEENENKKLLPDGSRDYSLLGRIKFLFFRKP